MPQPVRLLCHPATPSAVPEALTVTLSPHTEGLLLRYQLSCAPAALRLPAPLAAPGFADGLWQHSCCELFVAGAGSAYREFNFAPSGEWAAYAFSDYRQRVEWTPPAAPHITVTQAAGSVTLQAFLPHALLPADAQALGLTAVIEAADGSLSYWALHHASERPDFHRRESFTLQPEAQP